MPLVDPWGGFKQGTNALRDAAALNETSKRTAIADRRTNVLENQDQRAQENQKMAIAQQRFEMLKSKMSFAGQMIPRTTKKNYKNVYNAIQKLFENDPNVALVDANLLPPDEVEKLSDKDFKAYKSALDKGAREIAQTKDLETFKTNLKEQLEEHKSSMRMKEETQKQKGRVELEKTKEKNKDKEDPKLKDIRNRIQSVNSEIRRLRSGVNIYIADENKEGAIQKAEEERDKLTERYVELGGDRGDVAGKEPVKPSVSSAKKRYMLENGKLVLKTDSTLQKSH